MRVEFFGGPLDGEVREMPAASLKEFWEVPLLEHPSRHRYRLGWPENQLVHKDKAFYTYEGVELGSEEGVPA